MEWLGGETIGPGLSDINASDECVHTCGLKMTDSQLNITSAISPNVNINIAVAFGNRKIELKLFRTRMKKISFVCD